jgi:hypothetical protein
MFIEERIVLAMRKERLLARIETQRNQLAAYGVHLEKPFAAVDKLVQAGRYVKARPWIAGVAVLCVLLLRRRSLLGLASRGWALWRGWRFASRWLRHYGIIKI